MAGTRVLYNCAPVTVDVGTRFQVAARCTQAGTLPDTGVFLYQIVQVNDPKNDQLVRVVDVTDFTSYGTSRDAAIQAGVLYYRAPTFSTNYDDVQVATGGRQELSGRLTTLVTSYDQYIDAFLTPATGEEILYPAVDESTRTALIAGYEATLPAVTAAESARDAHAIECDTHALELQMYQERLVEAQADLATVTPIKTACDACAGSYPSATALIGAVANTTRALNDASSATLAEQASIRTQVSALDTQVGTLAVTNATLSASVQAPLTTLLGTLQSRVNDLMQATNTAQAQVNDCQNELARLQAAVDQARLNRDNALAAVRAVCPDYVPGS